MTHKSGFVNIIGYPNVGKSTLMNALVGEKLSIITNKAQTTRNRIMGIVSGEDFQIVYSDTPGIVRKPAYKMHEMMNNYIEMAFQDADILLLMTEPGLKFDEEWIIKKIKNTNASKIVLINKIDLSSQDKIVEQINYWQDIIPQAEVIPISAIKSFNIDKVFETIIDKLPESPAYFPKNELTDRSERFFAAEIIREKIFLNYKKEVPYSSEVIIDTYKESENIININAFIYVERESQKGILLGKQGSAMKKTGTMARLEMEKFFEKKIFLQITVKVNKDWRNNENVLKRFGFDK